MTWWQWMNTERNIIQKLEAFVPEKETDETMSKRSAVYYICPTTKVYSYEPESRLDDSYAEPKQRKSQNSKEIQIESHITMPIVLTDNTWTTSIVNKVMDDCNDNLEPT